MPYIRYKGRMYNVTTGEYIDTRPITYSFDRYTGSQFQDITGLTNRNDIIWNGYLEGEAGLNIGYHIEYWAKKYYYDSGLTEWPVLRILTTNAVDDYYIEWNHNTATYLSIKANGVLQKNSIPFIWDDNIDISGDPYFPHFNTVRARVFTTVTDKEGLLSDISYIGSFSPNDTTGGWFTRVNVLTDLQYTVTDPSWIVYSANTYLGTNGHGAFYKTYDGNAIAFWSNPDGSGNYGAVLEVPASGNSPAPGWNGSFTNNLSYYRMYNYTAPSGATITILRYSNYKEPNPVGLNNSPLPLATGSMNDAGVVLGLAGLDIVGINSILYEYLSGVFSPIEPPSDVDPEDIPPADEEPQPIPPDIIDPYYDPTSDPESPEYEPTKDPENPSYDPTIPHTPWRPPSYPTPTPATPPQPQPPIDPVLPPVTPPSYVTTNDLFTLYNPSGGDLTNIANFLWSPAWSIDTFKKIFANPLDCILALMVMPQLPATVSTKEMNIGNIPTGISLHYFTSQFYDFDCGTFDVLEYYNSYLDYSPYTKINIYLPYIGDKVLNTDEVMGKTIGVKYRFDLATGDCVSFITVDGTVMYTFSGNCAARLPLSASNYSGLVPSILSAVGAVGTMSGMPALGTAAALTVTAMKQDIAHSGSVSGSAGLMGVQTPYLIITRPRQAFPRMQNSFTGYPSFITESLGSLNGYTEIESCHLEHIPATADELNEIERLLKEGVLF